MSGFASLPGPGRAEELQSFDVAPAVPVDAPVAERLTAEGEPWPPGSTLPTDIDDGYPESVHKAVAYLASRGVTGPAFEALAHGAHRCPDCHGDGYLRIHHPGWDEPEQAPCRLCAGTGCRGDHEGPCPRSEPTS